MPEQRFNYLEEKEAGKKVREFGSFPFKKKKKSAKRNVDKETGYEREIICGG